MKLLLQRTTGILIGLALAPACASNAPRPHELISPFPSTVEGLKIPNAHLVSRKEGEVLRGMNPMGKVPELRARGITDILIFKDNSKGEVTREITELTKAGYTPDRIHSIPFRWHDITSFREACEQTLDALTVLETVYHTPKGSVFFHCTVGEDRTGMLAGLFRMIEMREQGWNTRKAFEEEMCLNGYGAGNPQKPEKVVRAIRTELTPVFLKLAAWVEDGTISAGHLDRAVCGRPVEARWEAKDFICAPSPLYNGGQ